MLKSQSLLKPFFLILIVLSGAFIEAVSQNSERAEFGLALIDVETTGLDADVHEMIDIGAVYVDTEGQELGRFFIRVNPAHPDEPD